MFPTWSIPLPHGRLLHPRAVLTNCKSCRMQHCELPQHTHKTQTYNICMTKHSHSPYTSTYSSMLHNTNRKHIIHHTPYTNILQYSKAKKHYLYQRPLHNKHSHRPPHNHYNRHKNKHAPNTWIYYRHASSHKKQ